MRFKKIFNFELENLIEFLFIAKNSKAYCKSIQIELGFISCPPNSGLREHSTMTTPSSIGQLQADPLKVHHHDDPDPQKAGQGLAFAPMVFDVVGCDYVNYWMMSPSEQAAMVYLLEHRSPRVAIEIGTRFGGSLQVLSRYSERVYSLDIDPEVPGRLEGRHSNVEYLIGPSDETLPPLIERLEAEGAEIGFVLVDGDHSAEGVRRDINNVLRIRPKAELLVVMHDSFNPECRRGLCEAAWASCPQVHAVELDFVCGTVNPSPKFRGQLWGGLALGVLRPEPRRGRFEVTGRADLTIAMIQEGERLQARRSLPYRAARKIYRAARSLAGQ